MLVSRISPAPRSTPSRAQCDHVAAAARAAARNIGVPAAAVGLGLGIDREHHALGAEDGRELVDQLRSRERSRVHRDLVGAGVEHGLGVGDRADAPADRERDEDLIGGAPRELDDRLALLVRGGDVKEDKLVGAFAVVVGGELDGIAGVADVEEFDALDDAPGVDVQAGDDALEVHGCTVAPRGAQAQAASACMPRRR